MHYNPTVIIRIFEKNEYTAAKMMRSETPNSQTKSYPFLCIPMSNQLIKVLCAIERFKAMQVVS